MWWVTWSWEGGARLQCDPGPVASSLNCFYKKLAYGEIDKFCLARQLLAWYRQAFCISQKGHAKFFSPRMCIFAQYVQSCIVSWMCRSYKINFDITVYWIEKFCPPLTSIFIFIFEVAYSGFIVKEMGMRCLKISIVSRFLLQKLLSPEHFNDHNRIGIII